MFARLPVLCVLTFLVILLSGCVTPVVDKPPRWITGVDESYPEGTRFVAYGRNPERGPARDAAIEDAFRRVEQLIIRKLETYPVSLGPDFAERIEETARIRVESLQRLDEFRRVDGMDNHEVFLLLLYLDSELRADAEAVAGRSLADEEGSPSAVESPSAKTGSSIETVRRLLGGDVPSTPVARMELLQTALAAAADIIISLQPGESTVPLGDETGQTIQVSVQDRKYPEAVTGISMALRIVGPEIDGNRPISRRSVRTMNDGYVSAVISPRQFAGITAVTVEPEWFGTVFERWTETISTPDEEAVLGSIAERLRDTAVLRVTSQAATVPTAVIILDRDIAGNPITGTDAMAGVLQELGAIGFRVRRVDLNSRDRDRLAALDVIEVADLYDILPFDVLASVDRAVVGDARILAFTENEGFDVVVAISAVTFDLRRDRRLAAVSVTERISGSSAQATIRAAFQESGRHLARRLAPQLP